MLNNIFRQRKVCLKARGHQFDSLLKNKVEMWGKKTLNASHMQASYAVTLP